VTEPNPGNGSDEEALGHLLSVWQARREAGEDTSAGELCRDRPELLPELERRIAASRGVARLPGGIDQQASTVVGGLPPDPSPPPGAGPAPGPTPGLPAGRAPAGYEVLGELGRGGMGVVYKARQTRLGRLVALKMILSGAHAGPEELARFRTEAEAIARLQHPHIVQVFEVGEHQGRPFLVLEFCPGGGLDRRLGGTPLPAQDAARLAEALARAMSVAHRAGIVHRDLKPANVLLGDDGGPKITDFGLARKLDAAGPTRTGAVVGTPSYMAPEQAAGRVHDIGPWTDVYALGAVLYELLTGRPPFRAESALDTVLQVLEREPVPPRLLNPAVPRDLELICLKCLQKDPHKRYPSAEALADDLTSFRSGGAVSARSYNVFDWLASSLERSHYDVQFYAWGTMLLWCAAVIFVAHVVLVALWYVQPPHLVPWAFSLHIAEFAALAALFWRRRSVVPASTVGRQMWAIVGGLVVACNVSGAVTALLLRPYTPLAQYPYFAVLSGLTFLILGSSYWGWCYLFAAAFWLLALVMPLHLGWGVAGFGLLWTAALVTVGRRLRRLGRQAEARQSPR
jgi:serine/threonine-protein kinase